MNSTPLSNLLDPIVLVLFSSIPFYYIFFFFHGINKILDEVILALLASNGKDLHKFKNELSRIIVEVSKIKI